MAINVQTLPLTSVVRPGRKVCRQGQPADGLWLVQTGALFAELILLEGRRWGLLLGPGDLVGEPDGLPAAAGVTALRPSRLREVTACDAPALLAARGRRLAVAAAELAWTPAQERVRRRLMDAAALFGHPVPGGRSLGVRLSQEQLATLAGTTRESANRAIRALVRAGRVRVTGQGRYVISELRAVGS